MSHLKFKQYLLHVCAYVCIYFAGGGSVCVLVVQSCPTFCDPMDCSPTGSSVHEILQASKLEWVAIPFSRGSSCPRDQIWVSRITSIFFTIWTTREAQGATPFIRISKEPIVTTLPPKLKNYWQGVSLASHVDSRTMVEVGSFPSPIVMSESGFGITSQGSS